MLDKDTIRKELKEQINNFKKIQKTSSKQSSQKLLDSIHGTEQRNNILSNTDINELYDMYISEIESTSSLIFPEGATEKDKVLNALEYMRYTVNKESETIANIDDINISGINSAVLGEGNESSQNSYLRDLLNNSDVEASIVNTTYTDENGRKAQKELVQVNFINGQSILLSPTDYNGSLYSIEKYNNGDYTKVSNRLGMSFADKSIPNTLQLSDDDITNSMDFVSNTLIDKYHIRDISNIGWIGSDASLDNQLKILNLVSNNLTPIQSERRELFRSARMFDGKEIEASKFLELIYKANNIQYTQYFGSTKDSNFFEFNGNGVNYTISPDFIFSKSQGKNIQTSNIIQSDDKDAEAKLLGLDVKTPLQEVQSNMKKKIENYNTAVRDLDISDIQEQLNNPQNSLADIMKDYHIKHYSLDDISHQLGLPELLKTGNSQDTLKAHSLLMAYLNKQSYKSQVTGIDAINSCDGYSINKSYIQELFFRENNIDYHYDENNNLVFKVGNDEYYWKEETKLPLSNNARSQLTFPDHCLVNAKTQEKMDAPELSKYENELIRGVIPLSKRIPTSKEEIREMSERLSDLNSDIEKQHYEYSIDSQLIKRKEDESIAQNSPDNYNKYLDIKDEKKEFYNKDDNQVLQEYKQKVKSVAQSISSSCKTDEDKALAVMEYMRLSGRYENISKTQSDIFKIGSRLSQDGMSYALTGEGVCASQAEFSRDILNELGLEADVEVCQVEDNPNVLIADSANHEVTKVKINGKSTILDPTNYDGTLESLQFPGIFSIADVHSKAETYKNSMIQQGKSQDEIQDFSSKLYESYDIKEGISAEIYNKLKFLTPFGAKTLKEMHFNTLDTTNEKIAKARKVASNIAIKEYGIDEISQGLNISGASKDIDKQSLIFGYIEDNLKDPEFENTDHIRSRIVKIGDKSLELNDVLELFYNANNIDYDIVSDHSLSIELDNENSTIDTFSAYKKPYTPVQDQRNSLIQRSDRLRYRYVSKYSKCNRSYAW